MNTKTHKWSCACTNDELLRLAAASVYFFLLAFLFVFVYFGDAPKYIPTLLAVIGNVFFLRCASLSSANFVDLGISLCFFVLVVSVNLLPNKT